MGNRSLRLYIVNLVVGIASVNLAYLLGFFLSFSGITGTRNAAVEAEYRWMLVVCNLLFMAVFTVSHSVRWNGLRSYVYFVVLYLGAMTLLQGQEYSRLFHLFFLGALLGFTVFVERAKAAALIERRIFRRFPSEIVAVGGDYDPIVKNYVMDMAGEMRLAAFFVFDASAAGPEPNHSKIEPGDVVRIPRGDLTVLSDFIGSRHVDELLVIPDTLATEDATEVLAFADRHHLNVNILPPYAARLGGRALQVDYWRGLPMISMAHSKLALLPYRIAKRVFDIAFSLLFLVILMPFCAFVIAPAIRFGSRGPVLFRQLRKGYRQEPFYCYKFRTMRDDNAELARQATRADDRVTRFGRLLRKTSLDELPQFVNVFLGKMSIVGPRPHMVEHDEYYDKVVSRYNVRFVAKPGITGWAQVNGLRGETETYDLMQKRIEHDLWYIKNWSVLLDLRIMLATAGKIVRGDEKAY